MSNFGLTWTPNSDDQLANIWIVAPDRPAVTAAAYQIERRLCADPVNAGYELAEGLYRIDVAPLAALYQINEALKEVEIESVFRLV
jgi:hypothetical protein